MAKTALVTGGSDGVGLSLARAFVRDGFEVHFIGSNPEKGKAVEAELKAQAGPHVVKFWPVDLSDLASVRRFADQFAGEVSSLERLVFSAGVILPKREETSQGIEKTLAINYLSAYLLAQRLKGLLVRGHKPRVLFVSGGGAIVLKSRLDFADFQTKQGYLAPKAAMRAVHAKTVLAQILAEDWKELGISVNAFHPGVVRSKLGRNLPWPINKLADVAALAMSPDSKMGIAAALADEFEGLSGYHFEGKKRERLSFDADYCKRLREASEGLVGR